MVHLPCMEKGGRFQTGLHVDFLEMQRLRRLIRLPDPFGPIKLGLDGIIFAEREES